MKNKTSTIGQSRFTGSPVIYRRKELYRKKGENCKCKNELPILSYVQDPGEKQTSNKQENGYLHSMNFANKKNIESALQKNLPVAVLASHDFFVSSLGIAFSENFEKTPEEHRQLLKQNMNFWKFSGVRNFRYKNSSSIIILTFSSDSFTENQSLETISLPNQ